MSIVIREVDNWITVYKDGKAVYGNHRCSLEEGLACLGIPYEYEYRDAPDVDGGDDALYDWINAEEL